MSGIALTALEGSDMIGGVEQIFGGERNAVLPKRGDEI